MRRSSLLFAAMAVALIVLPATAAVIHIPSDYGTIQTGIDASIDGDTVLVAAGTYSGHISFMGKDIVVKSESGPEVTMIQAETDYMPIIEFNHGEPSSATVEGFNISNASNLSAVRIQNSGATLKGNIFIDNHGGWDGYDGGAVNAVNGTILSILNNVFRSNSCFNAGGP